MAEALDFFVGRGEGEFTFFRMFLFLGSLAFPRVISFDPPGVWAPRWFVKQPRTRGARDNIDVCLL